MRVIFFLSILMLVLSSCDKDSGEGGTSVIQGQVYKIFTSQDPFSGEWDTAYFQLDAGKDVFIIYSDNEGSVYDDNFETDYNGRYHFEYLRQGDYIVYTYADSTDNSNVKYDYPIFKHIKISSSNSTNIVEDFIIEENQ